MEIRDIFPRWTSNDFVSRLTTSLSAQQGTGACSPGSTVLSAAADTYEGTGKSAARHGWSKTLAVGKVLNKMNDSNQARLPRGASAAAYEAMLPH